MFSMRHLPCKVLRQIACKTLRHISCKVTVGILTPNQSDSQTLINYNATADLYVRKVWYPQGIKPCSKKESK